MKRILSAAIALSLLGAGAPALADHGRGDKQHAKAHKKAVKAHSKAVKAQQKAWRKGQYIPAEHRHHYLSEPYGYGLPAPPPGYRWVLVEDDAYMVRQSDGFVSDLVMNLLLGR